MDQQKIFATTMFGFDKKMVLDYIYEQDTLAKEQEARCEAAIAQAEQDIGKLRAFAENQRTQIEESKARLEEVTNAQKASEDKLRREMDRLVQTARHKEKELQLQMEMNKQLKEKLAQQELRIQELMEELSKVQAVPGKQSAGELFPKISAPTRDPHFQELHRLREELDAFRSEASQTIAKLESSIARLYDSNHREERHTSFFR